MSRSVGELLGAAVVDRWNFFNVEGYLYVHPAVLMADVGCKDSVGTLVEIESSVVRGGVTAFGEMTSSPRAACMWLTPMLRPVELPLGLPEIGNVNILKDLAHVAEAHGRAQEIGETRGASARQRD